MAECQTNEWVNTAPYVVLYVEQESSSDTSVTLSWVLRIVQKSKPDLGPYTDRNYTVTIDGSTVKSGTYAMREITTDLDGAYVSSGTKKVSKTSSSRKVSFGVTFNFNLTWSGVYKSSLSASSSITIPALSSYTVSYNANGGTGAPSSQSKTAGQSITLSTGRPTRAGYTFKGWGTSSGDTSVDYNPGATYSANASITLYAIWTAHTYTVEYNANGGTGGPSKQTKTHGVALTLSGTKPERADHAFVGWATSPSATSATYLPGGSYAGNASITLYAVWSLTYTKPRITSVTVLGNIDATNTMTTLQVAFSWATDNPVTKIQVKWAPTGDSNPDTDDGVYTHEHTYTFTAAEINFEPGKIEKTFSTYNLNPDISYTVTISVSDGNTDSTTTSTSRMFIGNVFPIDVLPENRGIAFGKSAELDNYMDVGYYTLFRHESLSYHSDVAYAHIHEKSGLRVAFGYGAGGANHGIWDDLHNRWIFYNNGKDTFIGDAHGNLRPYFRPGDSFTLSPSASKPLQTAGYCTNSKTEVHFAIPLSKPLMAVSKIYVTSVDGLILRSNGNYSHGTAANTRVYPTSYTATKTPAGFIYVIATFSDTTNAVNNAPIGIDASITVTFE